MTAGSNNILSMVFESAVKGDIGEFSLDGNMLRVLMQMDGKKTLSEVARSLRMEPGLLKKTIKHLYQNKLIRRVEKTIAVIDAEFMDYLQGQLSRSVGPIAEILIEDEIADMAAEAAKLPVSRAAELVELLARQIPREEKRVAFQKAMIDKIRSKGY